MWDSFPQAAVAPSAHPSDLGTVGALLPAAPSLHAAEEAVAAAAGLESPLVEVDVVLQRLLRLLLFGQLLFALHLSLLLHSPLVLSFRLLAALQITLPLELLLSLRLLELAGSLALFLVLLSLPLLFSLLLRFLFIRCVLGWQALLAQVTQSLCLVLRDPLADSNLQHQRYIALVKLLAWSRDLVR